MLLFNIILVILLLNQLINFILGRKIPQTLNCGIWAFFGNTPRSFDLGKFHTLGILNDSRGGDGAGALIDNKLYHITGSLYKNLATDYLMEPAKIENVVLGHARKASSGGKLLHYSQPFLIKKPDNTYRGACIHNGTLYNHYDLREKYKVPEKLSYGSTEFRLNDTQISWKDNPHLVAGHVQTRPRRPRGRTQAKSPVQGLVTPP